MIIQVVIGATGIAIPRKRSTDSLQKRAILGTFHIIQKVLQSETGSLRGGDHCWFKRSSREERPVTTDMMMRVRKRRTMMIDRIVHGVCKINK
jgi:hypothetical protein